MCHEVVKIMVPFWVLTALQPYLGHPNTEQIFDSPPSTPFLARSLLILMVSLLALRVPTRLVSTLKPKDQNAAVAEFLFLPFVGVFASYQELQTWPVPKQLLPHPVLHGTLTSI